MNNIDKIRLDNALTYIKDTHNISSLLKQWGLPTNRKTIPCPLHDDLTPSCAIDIENNRYHCFSCGSHGSYVNLLYDYTNKVKGVKKSFSQIVEDILKEDPNAKNVLGFNTIFIESKRVFEIDDYIDIKYKPYKPVYKSTFSHNRILKEVSGDINNLLDYFSCIEKGLPTSMIYDKFVRHNDLTGIVTLNEIKDYGDELRELLDFDDKSDDTDVGDVLNKLLTDDGNSSSTTSEFI